MRTANTGCQPPQLCRKLLGKRGLSLTLAGWAVDGQALGGSIRGKHVAGPLQGASLGGFVSIQSVQGLWTYCVCAGAGGQLQRAGDAAGSSANVHAHALTAHPAKVRLEATAQCRVSPSCRAKPAIKRTTLIFCCTFSHACTAHTTAELGWRAVAGSASSTLDYGPSHEPWL